MIRTILAAGLAGLVALSPAGAQTPPPGKDTSIPFVRFGEIWDFHADGDRGVFLQNRSRRWFYASILGPCTQLPFAVRIGVLARGGLDRLDDTGAILVDGERCEIDRLVASDGPPRKAHGKKAG